MAQSATRSRAVGIANVIHFVVDIGEVYDDACVYRARAEGENSA